VGRPAACHHAEQQADRLLARRLPGARGTSVAAHRQRARQIAGIVYRRWQIGPYQWQLKHLHWFLEIETRQFLPSTRYRYWLTVRLLVLALGREKDWLPRLSGPWLRPTGRVGTLSPGRPIKRPC